MGFSAVLLALTAVQAISQVSEGYALRDESELNATIIEGKAGLIDIQKGIEYGQYQRAKGLSLSEGMARTGGAGIKPTGSAMAVMLDTQRQMSLDQAVGQFNFEQEKRYTRAEAGAVRRGGARAVRAGYSNAFSTMLSGASKYAMYKGVSRLTQEGTVRDTTFDTVVKEGK